MKLPLQISWRNVEATEALENAIREKAEKLDTFYDKIMGCRVVVEAPHGHHRKGKQYKVRVDITVPGEELVVNKDPGRDETHEDLYVAIRDAFDAARRRLQDYVRQRRGQVKGHEIQRHARVLRLFPAQGYGFLQTPDGREIYFHRNALGGHASFDYLDVGTEVLYEEEEGKEGPQAVRVTVGKHHAPA